MISRTLAIAAVSILALAAVGVADRYCLLGPNELNDDSIRSLTRDVARNVLPKHPAPTMDDAAPVREEVMIDERFTVQPGELIEIDNVHSDVFIETGAGNEARVRVVLSGSSERARAFFEHLNFQVDKSGRTLSVVTDPRGSWNGSSGGADIDVHIRIPTVFDADVSTAHGDVEVGELKGELRFDVAHGDLEADGFSGSLLRLAVAHGDLAARHLASEKAQLDIQHGDIEIAGVTAMEIDVNVQHGDVDVRDVTASEIGITAAHGDIRVARLDGYPEMSATHGDISINLVNARGGAFSAHHGDIDISTSALAEMDVDLSGSDIKLDTAYQFQGRSERDRIEGSVSGGGPKLAAKSTHGHIRLRASSTAN